MDEFFEIKATQKDSNLFLKLYFCKNDQKICIVDNISDIKALNSLREKIKKSIDNAFLRGEKFFLEFEKNKQETSEQDDPSKIWKKMAAMEDDEMISYFNSLPEEMRKKISSYVFSTVNMFKGKGLIFATCFNQQNSLIEKD